MLDFNELRRLANAAIHVYSDTPAGIAFENAASPDVVLALLDRLERAEAEAKRIYQVKLSDDQAFANEVAKLHALLADAGKALEPFASEAFVWRSPDDYAVVVVGCGADEYPSFCVGHLRAARNVATKIEEALK